MQSQYMKPRGVRRYMTGPSGTIKAAELKPVGWFPVGQSEGGALSVQCAVGLEPVAGRLINDITAEMVVVHVPAPAMDAHKNPEDDMAMSSDRYRNKLTAGEFPFALEPEGEISKSCDVTPKSIDGALKLCESVRLGHNVAVNHLRRLKHAKADQLDNTNAVITRALLSHTALDRLGGVLDPDDHVDGSVRVNLPNVKLPVSGFGRKQLVASSANLSNTPAIHYDPDMNPVAETFAHAERAHYDNEFLVRTSDNGIPILYANGDLLAQEMSLRDFYIAERMDQLTRTMRQFVDENPQYGEEIVAAWAHGLTVSVDNQPMVLYKKRQIIGKLYRQGMDGAGLDVEQTDMSTVFDLVVPVPKTEFGGAIYVFLVIRPDEVLKDQPDPFATSGKLFGPHNYAADELKLTPVPVTMRELHADVPAGSEETVAMYVGNNHIMRNYNKYGWARDVDEATVDAKNQVWQYEVPASVTPENVLYDTDELENYPFIDQRTDSPVASYAMQGSLTVATPLIFGPSPVEKLAAIDEHNVFGDVIEEV